MNKSFYENGKNIQDIQPFDSIIRAKACNNNDREVYLQYKQSNVKYSTVPNPNKGGKYGKIKVKYPKEYNVQNGNTVPMIGGECEEFKIEKTIDPEKKK